MFLVRTDFCLHMVDRRCHWKCISRMKWNLTLIFFFLTFLSYRFIISFALIFEDTKNQTYWNLQYFHNYIAPEVTEIFLGVEIQMRMSRTTLFRNFPQFYAKNYFCPVSYSFRHLRMNSMPQFWRPIVTEPDRCSHIHQHYITPG